MSSSVPQCIEGITKSAVWSCRFFSNFYGALYDNCEANLQVLVEGLLTGIFLTTVSFADI